jgi:hypothetical protein
LSGGRKGMTNKYVIDVIKTNPRYAPIGDRVLFLEARVERLEELVAVLVGKADTENDSKMMKHLEKAMQIIGDRE